MDECMDERSTDGLNRKAGRQDKRIDYLHGRRDIVFLIQSTQLAHTYTQTDRYTYTDNQNDVYVDVYYLGLSESSIA